MEMLSDLFPEQTLPTLALWAHLLDKLQYRGYIPATNPADRPETRTLFR